MLVPVLALVAAALLGVSAVLMHRGALLAPPCRRGPALLRLLVAQPVWLGGATLMAAGLAAQAIALSLGQLTVVEPLLTTSLLFGLPLSAATLHVRFGPRELLASVAVVGGIALFLLVGTPYGGGTSAPLHDWAVAGGVVAVVALAAVVVGHRYGAVGRAAGLATAGGSLTGLVDALMRSVGASATSERFGLLLTWEPYALVAVGVVSLVLLQHAFREGHLQESLPASVSSEPVVGSLLGIVVLHEHLDVSAVGAVLLLAATALMVFGIATLGSSPLVAGDDEREHAVQRVRERIGA